MTIDDCPDKSSPIRLVIKRRAATSVTHGSSLFLRVSTSREVARKIVSEFVAIDLVATRTIAVGPAIRVAGAMGTRPIRLEIPISTAYATRHRATEGAAAIIEATITG